MTLSCLIVIAALFSQITFTIPQSSSPKVIDVYFFYFIVRLFITFAHHGAYAFFLRGAKPSEIASREDGGADIGEDFEKEKFEVGEPRSGPSRSVTKLSRGSSRKACCCRRRPRVPSRLTHRVWSFEMRSCARVFNIAGIVWCVAIDLACMTLLFCWIYSARQGAALSFEENQL